jgi:tRNA nucleotidyltransferase (CCA-adding enzyme)
MDIIIGHSNMDLDCIAAIVLARKLYPDHVAVKSGTIHPVARNLYNLYETELNFIPSEELAGKTIDSIVMVDTRSLGRVNEFLQFLDHETPQDLPPVTIYDHHPDDSNDFPDATIIGGDFGSSATILGELVMDRGIALTPKEATIALAGIYSDTGTFTHQNVGSIDFRVASWLLDQKASLRVATSMVRSLRAGRQVDLFHEAMNHMVYQTINGHLAGHFLLALPKNTPGLAAIVERVFEVESPDVVFGVFGFEKPKAVLLVARSRSDRIPVNRIMGEFGGGGHGRAASALVKESAPDDIIARFWETAERCMLPALNARDIMSNPVLTVPTSTTLVDASIFLEEVDHTGVPVVSDTGKLVGFLTLRDIMKGRKAGRMSDPVKGYMTQRVYTCEPTSTLRDLERLFFTHNVGHLPVIQGEELVGMVTRSDYLRIIRDPTDNNH